eukprot:scaffold2079_cov122-Isochrysis_galbana.AAC.2
MLVVVTAAAAADRSMRGAAAGPRLFEISFAESEFAGFLVSLCCPHCPLLLLLLLRAAGWGLGLRRQHMHMLMRAATIMMFDFVSHISF